MVPGAAVGDLAAIIPTLALTGRRIVTQQQAAQSIEKNPMDCEKWFEVTAVPVMDRWPQAALSLMLSVCA